MTRTSAPTLCGTQPRSSSGTNPARTTEDLPTPDGPETTTSLVARSRSVSARTAALRPWNRPASAGSYTARPRYGQTVTTGRVGPGTPAATPSTGPGSGSSRSSAWIRTACSMRASAGPGSTPRSFTRRTRARRAAASASACRSLRYSASISRIHQPSRSGSAAIRASSSATSSRCRPRSRSTSTRASRIEACRSARRRRSPSAQPAVRQSSNGSPRQYARAASNWRRAETRSPSARAARAADTATAAAPTSTDSGLTASA